MMRSSEAAQSKALSKFFERMWEAEAVQAVLSIRGTSPDPLRMFGKDRVLCLQTDRVLADRLEGEGFRVCTEAFGEFDLCLVEGTKHKAENLYHIALGWTLLRPGGQMVISVANALGGESLAKRLTQGGFPIRGTYSKAKCRLIWLERTASQPPGAVVVVDDWLALGELREIPGTGLLACPGMFSAQAVDAGTRLLAETLPPSLRGHGADFGAGYGALSRHILAHSPQLLRLDLYEVEWKALAAARLNLAAYGQRTQISYHWQDVRRHAPARRFDWIAMNPPFHAGRESLPSLGLDFIRTAASSLTRDGTLWLVANCHLPYEAALAERFATVTKVGERQGFKVLRAEKPKSPVM